jgi:hypothetical protein
MDVVKRTFPNVPHDARPVDLFQDAVARIWQAKVGSGEAEHDLIGLFNWDGEKPATVTVDLKDIGLEAGDYTAFEFWGNEFVGTLSGKKDFELKPGACKILSLKKVSNRPQLISTSRHVLQGAPDLVEVKWDAATGVLSGKSKVIAKDPYELRIVTAGFALDSADANAGQQTEKPVNATAKTEGGNVRVTITSLTTQEVMWQVKFKPAAR